MNYLRHAPRITGYIVSGYDIELYCKLTETNIEETNYKCVISFGGGIKKFCLTAIFDNKKPTEIYIDRVDNNDLCLIDGKLRNYEKGTVKLIKIALQTIKYLFPKVTKLTLFDDSQIYCEENNKTSKLSLSYDYILKYNESWYQKNFKAELPGFISKKYIKNQPLPNIDAEPNTLMEQYNNSLKILDEPIMDYSLIINIFSQFVEFKDEYEMSKTPREFINLLRRKLKNEFCFKVGRWLNQYMVSLRIKLSAENWYILSSNIENVPNFSISLMSQKDSIKILNGGNYNKKITRKNKKQTHYRIISDSNFTDSFIGLYDDFE